MNHSVTIHVSTIEWMRYVGAYMYDIPCIYFSCVSVHLKTSELYYLSSESHHSQFTFTLFQHIDFLKLDSEVHDISIAQL